MVLVDLKDRLRRAQEVGFVGPGDLDTHIRHSLGFVELASQPLSLQGRGATLADLGSGGGVPGLVLASLLPETQVYLIEASLRRASWLEATARELRLNNLEVINRRAEDVGRDGAQRAQFDVVTARSFGRPAVTAECGAPLLREGGHLIASEPPVTDSGRWCLSSLEQLGLALSLRTGHGYSFAVLTLVSQPPAKYPRRAGMPAKRPLF